MEPAPWKFTILDKLTKLSCKLATLVYCCSSFIRMSMRKKSYDKSFFFHLKHKSRPERRQNVLAGTRIYLFTLTLGKFYYTHCTEEKLIKLQALDWKQTENIGETLNPFPLLWQKSKWENISICKGRKIWSGKLFAVWIGKIQSKLIYRLVTYTLQIYPP